MDTIPKESFDALKHICQTIYDKKGCNILVLDVRGMCTIADYFIIAEGTVARHLIAIADAVIDAVGPPIHVEGKRSSDWVVIDYGEYIIHLFTSEERERYTIERVWNEALIVDIPIVLCK